MKATPLVTLGVATANVVLLVLVSIIFLHRNGSLAESLGALSTESGVALFVALWWITWWSTRRGLRAANPLSAESAHGGWLRLAMHRGGIAATVFAVVVVGTIAGRLAPEGGLAAIIFFIFSAVFASAPAFVLGMLAGFVLGCLDLLCMRISMQLVRACASSRP